LKTAIFNKDQRFKYKKKEKETEKIFNQINKPKKIKWQKVDYSSK